MLGLGAVCPLLLSVLVKYFLPETPRWLMENGHHTAAHKVVAYTICSMPACFFISRLAQVMTRLCGGEAEASVTMREITEGIQSEHAQGQVSWHAVLCRPTPGTRLMLLVVLGMALAQQLVGADIITVYTPIVLEDQVLPP